MSFFERMGFGGGASHEVSGGNEKESTYEHVPRPERFHWAFSEKDGDWFLNHDLATLPDTTGLVEKEFEFSPHNASSLDMLDEIHVPAKIKRIDDDSWVIVEYLKEENKAA